MIEQHRQARANFYRKERNEGRRAVALAFYQFFKKQEQDLNSKLLNSSDGGEKLRKGLGLI